MTTGPFRVLILDADKDDAQRVLSELERAFPDIEARIITSDGEWRRALEQTAPDLILSEVALTGLPASKALEESRRRFPRIPFIIVAGADAVEEASKCVEAGADDYVLKTQLERLAAIIQTKFDARQFLGETERISEELRHGEALFRVISENITDLLVLLNADGAVLYHSASCREFFPEHPTSPPCFLDTVHPEDREKAAAALLEMIKLKEGRRLELRLNNLAGETHLVESQWSWVATPGTPHGNVLVVSRDITRRRLLETRLRQSQKMEAIGLMAGGVAHDFNNVLTSILGYASLLMRRLEKTDPAYNEAHHIYRASRRASELTRQLLAFSRHQILKPTNVDLNRIVRDSVSVLHRILGETIIVKLDLDPSRPAVVGDPGQLQQVVFNLAVNARDAMPDGGHLFLKTSHVTLQEKKGDLVPGDYGVLEVKDEGMGMDQKTLQNIFDPFYTTKAVGEGTGLGLSTVYGIIQQSQGHIEVFSKLNQGTRFVLHFPAAPNVGDHDSRDTPEELVQPPKPEALIMVVEDEAPLLILLKTILTSAGYRTVTASNADDALNLLPTHASGISLLISDVVLPGMSGIELAQQIWDQLPKLPILMISGYAHEALHKKAGRWKGERYAFLQKPFDPAEILATVKSLLQ